MLFDESIAQFDDNRSRRRVVELPHTNEVPIESSPSRWTASITSTQVPVVTVIELRRRHSEAADTLRRAPADFAATEHLPLVLCQRVPPCIDFVGVGAGRRFRLHDHPY